MPGGSPIFSTMRIRYSRVTSWALMWKPGRIFAITASSNERPCGTRSSEIRARGSTTELARGSAGPWAELWARPNAARESSKADEDASHYLGQRLAGFVQHEGGVFVGPAQLEAGGQGRNPDLPRRRVRADDELGLFRLLKQDFELPAFALDLEAVLVAQLEQAAAQGIQ